jgi:hypothetical protein
LAVLAEQSKAGVDLRRIPPPREFSKDLSVSLLAGNKMRNSATQAAPAKKMVAKALLIRGFLLS